MASVSVNTICIIRDESEHKKICAKIQNYLSNGCLFNPELMEHEKVRDMILQIRDYLTPTEAQESKQVESSCPQI